MNFPAHNLGTDPAEIIELVDRVRSNAERVNNASRERAAFVGELIERSRRVDGDISALREESQSAQNSLQATADAAAEIISEVQNIVELLDESIHGIASLDSRISAFEERFREVQTVSKTIIDVADRTKVLSINAMIEAARAGEHGRGFKVVANEVRELANASGSSAGQIATKLGELVKDAEEMALDCASLHKIAAKGTEQGKSNLNGLRSVHHSVLNSASDARMASAFTGEQIAAFAELIDGMESLQKDTEAAIDGSAKNIELTNKLRSSIEQTLQVEYSNFHSSNQR